MEPSLLAQLFSLGSLLALGAWVLLLVVPHARGIAQGVAGAAVPTLLALAYAVLVAVWWSRGEGGFGSIEEVRALFRSDAVLVAGWFHYLAFDLLIGAWIGRRARAEGIPHLVVVPLLVLTFLLGPVGYLGFQLLRLARRGAQIAAARAESLSGDRLGWIPRDPVLTTTAAFYFLLTIPTAAALMIDDRLIGGVGVWLKPLKFELSLGLFALTLALMLPMAGKAFASTWTGRFVTWGFAIPASLEIAYIVFRAARGEASHFNVGTPAAALGYALMGVGAVTLTATAPVLGWAIWQNRTDRTHPTLRRAVILGLVLTFALGGLEGMVMSASRGHAVGTPAPGDAGLPLFGWLATAGDLRVAHFFGLHAQQAIPLFTLLALALVPAVSPRTVTAFAALYGAGVAALFGLAVAGIGVP
jgi:hypothetical protein